MKVRATLVLGILVMQLFASSCSPSTLTHTATSEEVEGTATSTASQDQQGNPPSPTPSHTPVTLIMETEAEEEPFPDIIFHNGIILTMEQGQPQAEAIAIRGDLIYAVGSNEGVLALSGSDTHVVDLGGRTLLPGFIDSHAHWIGDLERSGYGSVDEIVSFLLENGWTSIAEMFVSQQRLEALLSLDQEGILRVRVNAYLPVNFLDQRFGRPYLQYEPGEVLSPHVRVSGVKFFTDNDWGNIINWEQSELNEEVLAVHEAGWQVAIHTFSVRGHEMVLEALGDALQGENTNEFRHRIEHVIAVTDEQLVEIQERGYIASIQPNFPGHIPQADPTFYDKIPEEDFVLLTRWEDIYHAGITIVSGSDWPWLTNDTFNRTGGAPAGSPLSLIYKAATHTDANNRVPDEWMRDQFLPVEATLQSLTINGAYGTFEENTKGSLAPGKWADIVILSDNPLTVSVEALVEIDILMTMIGGNVEYCAEGAEALCNLALADS